MTAIKIFVKVIWVIVFCFGNILTSFCQTKQTIVNFYGYNQSNGLSSPNIRKIDVDKYGFIWIATQDVLNRFDGKKFTVFNSNTSSTKLNTVSSDFHDFFIEDKLLYAVTAYGGINIVSIETNNVIVSYDISNQLPIGDFAEKLFKHNGQLYLFTKSGHLFFIDTANLKLTLVYHFKNIRIQSIVIKQNKLWIVADKSGLIIFDLEKKYIKKEFEFRNTSISNIASDGSNNTISLVANNQIHTIDCITYNVTIDSNFAKSIVKVNKNFQYRSLVKYKNNWLISTTDILLEYNATSKELNSITPYNIAENKNWLENVQALFCTNNLIITGNQTGITIINKLDNAIIAYSRSATNFTTKINHATHMYSINDSIVYSCDVNKVLFKTNLYTGNITAVDSIDYYFQIIPLKKQELLVSGLKGLKILKNDKLQEATKLYSCLSQLNNDFIIASLVLNDSLVLLASQNKKGIYVFNIKENKILIVNGNSQKLSIGDLAINNFYKDDDNVIVVAEKSISVLNFSNTKSNTYKIEDKKSNKIFSVLMDVTKVKDKYYFAAYGDGVVVTNRQFEFIELLSGKSGILNNGIYKIFKLNDSSFICSTNSGAYIYNVNTKLAKRLGKFEGLQSDNFEETSGEKSNNKLILGGKDGFTVFYPSKMLLNRVSPKLYYTHLSILLNTNNAIDSFNLNLTKYIIPNNTIQTTISFSAINYSNPERTTFKYRITEQSKEWIDLGTQNFVTLIGLSPGTYHLQVKAANEDDVWCEPKELILVFEPKWYQTWWFKLLVAFSIGGIVYAFYRYRIRQIQKQHEIRKNIATDLHDDLGSTLNSVKVFTNLAISGVNQNESLQQIKQNLNEATLGLRDMIWVLDDGLDTADELSTRLKQYAIPVAKAANIEVQITCTHEAGQLKLTKEEKRNLFLICKEALNNAIKYAEATLITVQINSSGKKLNITIIDNGKGFDIDAVKKGYGLKNMEYRAEQIKYTTKIGASKNKGTYILISPL